jgi:hypothetical protein
VRPPPRLHVIEGTPEPDTAQAISRATLKAQAKPADMVACPRCSGREFTETRTGVLMRNGKPTGGTRAMICTACLAQGQRVAIL